MVFGGKFVDFFRGRAEGAKVDKHLTDAPEAPTMNRDGVPEGVETPSEAPEPSAFGREAEGADLPESQLTSEELTEQERLAVVGIRQELNKMGDTSEPIVPPVEDDLAAK